MSNDALLEMLEDEIGDDLAAPLGRVVYWSSRLDVAVSSLAQVFEGEPPSHKYFERQQSARQVLDREVSRLTSEWWKSVVTVWLSGVDDVRNKRNLVVHALWSRNEDGWWLGHVSEEPRRADAVELNELANKLKRYSLSGVGMVMLNLVALYGAVEDKIGRIAGVVPPYWGPPEEREVQASRSALQELLLETLSGVEGRANRRVILLQLVSDSIDSTEMKGDMWDVGLRLSPVRTWDFLHLVLAAYRSLEPSDRTLERRARPPKWFGSKKQTRMVRDLLRTAYTVEEQTRRLFEILAVSIDFGDLDLLRGAMTAAKTVTVAPDAMPKSRRSGPEGDYPSPDAP